MINTFTIMVDYMAVFKLDQPSITGDPEIYPITPNMQIRPLVHGGTTLEGLTLGPAMTYLDKTTGINWVLPHSKEFPEFITKTFNGPRYVSTEEDFKARLSAMATSSDEVPPPFPYQIFIYEYMRFGTPNRSILLEHGLGSGKTRTVIMIAESFRAKGLETIILTPAFLKTNFEEEIKRWVPELAANPALIERYYKFVSYNAMGSVKRTSPNWGKGSMYEQLAKLGIGYPAGHKDSMPYLTAKYPHLAAPINKLIVIEEAHGLNRSFSNIKSQIKGLLYNLLISAVDCKIVMMTGTPVIGNPFELATMYNILRGPIPTPRVGPWSSEVHMSVDQTDKLVIFPNDEKPFIRYFIDYEGATILNRDCFMRRILGLGSYFRGITEDATGKIFPRQDKKIVELEMEDYQTAFHDTVLDEELEKEAGKKYLGKKAGHTVNAMEYEQLNRNSNSSYHAASRQACNFAFPTDIIRPRGSNAYPLQDTIGRSSFEFVNDDPEELIKLHDNLRTEGVPVPDIDENGTIDDLKQLLTDAIIHYYDNENFTGGRARGKYKERRFIVRGHWLSAWLTDADYYGYIMAVGLYKQQLDATLERLVQLNKENGYFLLNDNGLRNYSIKMYTIYKELTTNSELGAPIVTLLPQAPQGPEQLGDGEVNWNIFDRDDAGRYLKKDDDAWNDEGLDDDGDDDGGDEDDGDDGSSSKAAKSGKIDDDNGPKIVAAVVPDDDDPLMNGQPEGEKFRDVFLSDDKLDEKYGKGKWTIKGGPVMVYSFYNKSEGVGIFSKVLEAHGFEQYVSENYTLDPATISRQRRYAFIRGGMTPDSKKAILRVFNSKHNMHGQLIQVVFLTQAAAEGISLFQLRQIHVMEPFWDNTMIRQVIGRGLRLRSHFHLPEDERIVHIRQYHAIRSKNVDQDYFKRFPNIPMLHGQIKETTDVYLNKLATEKDQFQEVFLKVRKESAVDCMVNRRHNTGLDCFTFPNKTGLAFNHTIEKDLQDTKVYETGVEERKIVQINNAAGAPIAIHTSERKYLRLKIRGKVLLLEGIKTYELPADLDKVKTSQLVHNGYYVAIADQPPKLIPLHAPGMEIEESDQPLDAE